MNTTRRGLFLPAAGFGLLLSAVTGCQTWVPGTGQTLPSPHYLEHAPQYIPPSPAFPLARGGDAVGHQRPRRRTRRAGAAAGACSPRPRCAGGP